MEIENEEPKTEEAKVRRWLDRIKVASLYRDRRLSDWGVDRFVQEYNGDYDVRLGNMVVPPINEVFAYVQTLSAIINFRNPAISVNPKKSGSIKGARILEQAVAYDWRELKIKDETDLELIDCPLSGMGWHKTGYWAMSVEDDKELKLKDEGIYSNRVSWRDVVFNIGSYRPPNDCEWIAHRIVKPTYEVKELYPENSTLKGGPHPNLNKNEIKYSTYKEDIEFSAVWEIWSKRDKKVFHVAEDYNKKFLKKPIKWPDYMEDFPLDLLAFNHVPDEAFPMPDIRSFEPQILEMIKLVAMILNHVKRWNRMLLIKKGAIDPTEQDKLQLGIDGTFIEVNGEPSQSHTVLQYGPVPSDIYAILNRIEDIKNRISGLTPLAQGAPDNTKSRTLGELQMAQQGSGLRTDKKRLQFEKHLENIARKLISIRQANFDLDQIVKITGDVPQDVVEAFKDHYDPQTQTIKFTKEDIQGEYEVETVAGSTVALDKATKSAILQQVIEQGVKLAQLPVLPPFLQVAISELLRDYDIKALEVAFEAQNREAEMAKMKSAQNQNVDVEKTKAEADKRNAQAQSIRAKTASDAATTLFQAAKAGVLPEAIELGRGLGQFPSGNGGGQ